MSVSTIPQGLIVKAEQIPYPMELSSSEIYIHLSSLNEYKTDFIKDLIEKSRKHKPITKLINQQPNMPPQMTRHNLITFLFQLSTVCNVTDTVFSHAVTLYDRYSSKRIVLPEQSKLVVATCLWLSAKNLGGCDHIINEYVIPTGGRFYGPTPRARIPKINELIYYCGGKKHFNKSMFLQMERHILQTLDWNIVTPTLADLVLNIDENCLLQYEWYKRALLPNKNHYKNELYQIDNKIELIDIKMFLIDLTSWQYNLLDYEMIEVSNSIFRLLSKFLSQDCPNFIQLPDDLIQTFSDNMVTIDQILINAICTVPVCLFNKYPKSTYIRGFCKKVNNYQLEKSIRSQVSHPVVLGNMRASTTVKKNTITLQKIKSVNSTTSYPSPASIDYSTFNDIKLDDDTSNYDTSNDDYDNDANEDEDENDISTEISGSISHSPISVFSDHGHTSKISIPLSRENSKPCLV